MFSELQAFKNNKHTEFKITNELYFLQLLLDAEMSEHLFQMEYYQHNYLSLYLSTHQDLYRSYSLQF